MSSEREHAGEGVSQQVSKGGREPLLPPRSPLAGYSLFEARKLLYGAEASGDILPEQKRDMFLRAKEEFESMRSSLEDLLNQRAQEVEENINRLRRAGERRMKVKFVPPADLLGLYVLLPKPRK